MISLIAAVARNGVIGADNRMPWHLEEDMRSFRRTTLGHPVVMGSRTYRSLGQPLPGRRNIVLSHGAPVPGAETASSLEAALALCSSDEEVFVIGGASLYRQALPLADRLYLTRIDHEWQGDTRFPEWNVAEWRLVDRTAYPCGRTFPYPFAFERYERIK